MAFDLALEGKVRRISVDTRGSNTNVSYVSVRGG